MWFESFTISIVENKTPKLKHIKPELVGDPSKMLIWVQQACATA